MNTAPTTTGLVVCKGCAAHIQEGYYCEFCQEELLDDSGWGITFDPDRNMSQPPPSKKVVDRLMIVTAGGLLLWVIYELTKGFLIAFMEWGN